MAQPQWITQSGSLGTIPEGIFYQIPLDAYDPDGNPVYYELIAGRLPAGIQVLKTGIISGVPKSIVLVQGVPSEVSQDVTSKFAIRAYTTKVVNGYVMVDRIADRTFTLTVSGQDIPDFVTPAGPIGTYMDGTTVTDLRILFTDPDPDDYITVQVITGALPAGLTLNRDGTITGVIEPLVGPPGTAEAGWDITPNAEYPWEFATKAQSKNYQFTVEISDGKESNVRTFSIYVYAQDTMVASADSLHDPITGDPIPGATAAPMSADNTFLTADVTPARIPVLLTTTPDLGRVRADNFYAYKFSAIDFDGDEVEFELNPPSSYAGNLSLPPGLTLDPNTGWLYGYIPNQGTIEVTYRFSLRARQVTDPTLASPIYFFTITIVGDIETEITWLTPSDLGSIDNGATSTFYVAAVNAGGRELSYRIRSSSDSNIPQEFQSLPSKLPQGLRLLPSGHIAGRVSFNTFALDTGLTIFDSGKTTFDMEYDFTVNAYSPQTETFGYRVFAVQVIDGGSGYATASVAFSAPDTLGGTQARGYVVVSLADGSIDSVVMTDQGSGYISPTVTFSTPGEGVQAQGQAILSDDKIIGVTLANPGQYPVPTITIAPPPSSILARSAVASTITIINGSIISIELGDQGQGYLEAPTVVIDGGTGIDDATAFASVESVDVINSVSVYQRFKIRVVRAYTEPYESLYIKAMPPYEDRAVINQLIQNQDVIPIDLVYRADDPNFGVAKNVIYVHAYGLTASTTDDYVQSMYINHYWKNLILGEIKTARATDAAGNVIYEVVYSQIIDDQVNQQGESVSKSVELAYPVANSIDETITTVYPNSLINMRNQIIDQIGQVSTTLPAWMTSKQADGRVLGFTPAWVIAYTKPGQSGRLLYNIQQQFGDQLNKIDFKADRYELDRSLTSNWDPVDKTWIPRPPEATTFDLLDRPDVPLYILGFVGYATDLSFDDINGQPLEYIVSLGGINGATTVDELDGYTLIFLPQPGLTQDQSSTVYRIIVKTDNVVELLVSVKAEPEFNTADPPVLCQPSVTVQFGRDYSGQTLYLPVDPGPGQDYPTWTFIPRVTANETTFDGGATRFIAPADQYTDTDSYDRYLLFPRINILTPVIIAPPTPPDVVNWENEGGAIVIWVNNEAQMINWINPELNM